MSLQEQVDNYSMMSSCYTDELEDEELGKELAQTMLRFWCNRISQWANVYKHEKCALTPISLY